MSIIFWSLNGIRLKIEFSFRSCYHQFQQFLFSFQRSGFQLIQKEIVAPNALGSGRGPIEFK